MLIDSHCHLDDLRYDADREATIGRARAAGVGHFVTIGCDLETSRAAVTLAKQNPLISATVGVHPHEAKLIQEGWYDELRVLAQSNRVVAYGEIGLDYHYDHSPRDVQRTRFREQVQLARELRLPIVIHTREAQEDTIAILKEEKAGELGGVFHCFSGDAWLAKDALDLGFYLSFSGVITFQNALMLRDIVKTVPLDRILVETDSPYLTPAPHRGKRNEPAYVRFVAEKIAELHGMSVEQVEEAATQNTKRLFRIADTST
jgi:TatD DNase family protein